MTTHSARLGAVASSPPRALPAQRRHSLRPWVLFTVIVVAAFFGLTYSRIALDSSAFVLDTLEEEIAVETARVAGLRADVARLQDPGRIAAEATRMGMVFPDERVHLSVDEVAPEDIDPEHRWAQLKVLLTAQP